MRAVRCVRGRLAGDSPATLDGEAGRGRERKGRGSAYPRRVGRSEKRRWRRRPVRDGEVERRARTASTAGGREARRRAVVGGARGQATTAGRRFWQTGGVCFSSARDVEGEARGARVIWEGVIGPGPWHCLGLMRLISPRQCHGPGPMTRINCGSSPLWRAETHWSRAMALPGTNE